MGIKTDFLAVYNPYTKKQESPFLKDLIDAKFNVQIK